MKGLAIVTGAAGGMGSAVAHRLAADGHPLMLLDLDEGLLEVQRDEFAARGWECASSVVDVSDPDSVRDAFGEAECLFGPPWAVLSVAGMLEGGLVSDASLPRVRRVLEVNFIGTWITNREAVCRMKRSGVGGRIVNWSSVGAKRGGLGYAAYSSSKAAVERLTVELANEVGRFGITVNAVRPGRVKTAMLGYIEDDEHRAAADAFPIGRCGLPDEVARAAEFLVSEDSGWITGTVLTVDGGFLASKGSAIDMGAITQRLAREAEYQDHRPG